MVRFCRFARLGIQGLVVFRLQAFAVLGLGDFRAFGL